MKEKRKKCIQWIAFKVCLKSWLEQRNQKEQSCRGVL